MHQLINHLIYNKYTINSLPVRPLVFSYTINTVLLIKTINILLIYIQRRRTFLLYVSFVTVKG